MQNNVTELTQRLLRSLDSNYNVIDMPTVIEIISLLETVSITKELLEATRLGRHINNLRKNTSNESLAKSAKGLLKKWRNSVLPESNGQLKQPTKEDVNLNELKNKKRLSKEPIEPVAPKRTKLNGTTEFDFSDNSNSSFKDAVGGMNANANNSSENSKKDIVVLINSDSNSNSSIPDIKNEPVLEPQQPKKRGRKKGSGNHKNLIDEAETSFSNKMAVSRGNAKVKTTQELIASLQNKKANSANFTPTKSREDLSERAAMLTERVSIIDQKLYTNSSRYKNSQKKLVKNNLETKNDKVIESGIVVNISSDKCNSASNSVHNSEDEIVVDDDVDIETKVKEEEDLMNDEDSTEVKNETSEEIDLNLPRSLSIEEAFKRLPPIDETALVDPNELTCSCTLKEYKSDFSIGDEPESLEHKLEFIEDCNCSAKNYLEEKYHLGEVTEDRVRKLHESFIPCVNGNVSIGQDKGSPELDQNGLYVNVVPNVNIEQIPKKLNNDSQDFTSENYKKYSISDCASDMTRTTNESGDNISDSSQGKTFREWHEVVETTSYNGEILKILPYVIID